MSKRSLSPPTLPPAKRAHLEYKISINDHVDFACLSDEVVIHVFRYLSWIDLCAIQPATRTISRLALDNQLWKALYSAEYGRQKPSGALSSARHEDRETRSLPNRTKNALLEIRDWKMLFRINHNWRRGRCSVETIPSSPIAPYSVPSDEHPPSLVQLTGRLVVTATPAPTANSPPFVAIHHPVRGIHCLECPSTRPGSSIHVTAMTVDHSNGPSAQSSRLAVFLSTGEFSVYLVSHPTPSASSRFLRFVPRVRAPKPIPIIGAAYHHPLLITLSATFRLSIYDLSGSKPRITETFSSFTSYLPASLSLSLVPSPSSGTVAYKLTLAYSVAVYPAHWSVGATELLISTSTLCVTSTRTARACEIPFGFINAETERVMRAQWGRRVGEAVDVAIDPDNRWVVLGPGADAGTAPNALQLYRLHMPSGGGAGAQPKLTFVRHLHGLSGPVARLVAGSGRCVCMGADGSMRVWDLGSGMGAEICGPGSPSDHEPETSRSAALVFDDRKVISVGRHTTRVWRFDI